LVVQQRRSRQRSCLRTDAPLNRVSAELTTDPFGFSSAACSLHNLPAELRSFAT